MEELNIIIQYFVIWDFKLDEIIELKTKRTGFRNSQIKLVNCVEEEIIEAIHEVITRSKQEITPVELWADIVSNFA